MFCYRTEVLISQQFTDAILEKQIYFSFLLHFEILSLLIAAKCLVFRIKKKRKTIPSVANLYGFVPSYLLD